MTYLELLAPARNAEIGIAAIDCGADAVYIAGPAFGARQDAGNSVEDIEKLCSYASRYGARVFVTLNTILFDDEIPAVRDLMIKLQDVGVSAFIVQDLSLVELARNAGIKIPLHASTQCAIRSSEQAKMYETLGFSRIVLERQMSLGRIREIASSTDAEVEFFVHGALCVCYSGQCYLSENIAGRSANRGACIQACRSRFDLVNEKGKVLVKDKALLSLKDYNLISRLEDLAEAGVCSFKIEGRLKNISYVRNVTRKYSMELDNLVRKYPEKYCRSSFGKINGGFDPDLSKTFNRGYTELFLDGKRGHWAAMEIPKGRGEEVGFVVNVKPRGENNLELLVRTNPGVKLANGDGFTFNNGRDIIGFRADICTGNTLICKKVQGLRPGLKLYRNVSVAFEKDIIAGTCQRDIPVSISLAFSKKGSEFEMTAEAVSQDGRKVSLNISCGDVLANNQDRMRSMLETQLTRKAGDYDFTLVKLVATSLPLMSASAMNSIRRDLASKLDELSCMVIPMRNNPLEEITQPFVVGKSIDYSYNVSNSISRKIYKEGGALCVDDAYELSKIPGVELMRTKYCIRYELGMCLMHDKTSEKGNLYLVNNGKRFSLGFDCKNCEMTVKEASSHPHSPQR